MQRYPLFNDVDFTQVPGIGVVNNDTHFSLDKYEVARVEKEKKLRLDLIES